MDNHDGQPSPPPRMSATKLALLERWKRGEASATTIPRVGKRPPGAVYEAPLTSTQQRLWYLEQLVPGSPAYNCPFFGHLRGRLDVAALGRALTEIVRRHETLRSTFPTASGKAKQIIGAPFTVELAIDDISHHPAAERAARVAAAREEEARQLFSLERGPLFATRLLRLAPDEHAFFITIHHIVCDGWSLGILNRELAAIYAAYVAGQPSPLPEPVIQYGDYAAWQQRRLADGALRAHLDFWTRELAGVTPLALPTDRPRPAVQSFRGTRMDFTVPPALAAAVQEACRREDVTPYMFFLGAFTALLARYAGQDDIAVGSPIANRGRVETEGLIGFFSNTIVLRTDLSGDPSFRALLGRIRARSLAAFQHQDLPFEQLVNELGTKRDTSRNPLFQVMLVLQNSTQEQVPLAGLDAAFSETPSETSKFDLWLQLVPAGDRWAATLEYATDLFDAATMDRLAGHLLRVLQVVTAAPEIALSDIDLLDDSERHQVLTIFNDTARDYGPDRLLHEHVEAQVDRTPDAIAVSFEGETLTYAALERRANQLAHRLIGAGVGPDTLVGVYAERSANLVVALLAVLKSGGAYVPLDPSYPDERVEHMIRDAAVPVLITDSALPARLAARLTDVAAQVLRLDDDALLAGQPVHRPAVALAMDNLAYTIFTSGSTGLPKGAMNSHRGIANRLLWMQEAYGLGAADRVLQKTPFSFDVSVWELFWPLMTGARLVVARPGGHKDPAYLVDTIVREGITTTHFVPSMLQVTLDHPGVSACRSLVRVICSGEALPAEFRDRFFERLPGSELHNLYGPTEAAVDVTAWQCRPEHTAPTVPIGAPIANTRMYVLDDRRRPLPVGVPGELYIGGVNVGRGYLNRPALDAERFVPDPFLSPGAARNAAGTMYRTGDRARWLPTGDLEFLGRLDSQVKLRGLRIELGEIEHALRGHDEIADAAVTVRAAGDGDERTLLAAYVVPTQHGDGAALGEHVAQWETVFDQAYAQPAEAVDPALNLAGWNSSYDGAPIPVAEMLEWVESTVERVRAARPRRVLEIGCGTGLILLRVAPHCQSYLGTDTSAEGLRTLAPHVTHVPGVTLAQRSAERLDGVAPRSLDTVVVNSVAQYFPSAEYLGQVLAGCVDRVEDGGTIFLGDIRAHGLLPTFHGSVELARADADVTVETLRRRVDQRLFQDNELALSPLFFFDLLQNDRRVSDVRILLKRGRAGNELTRFRYDVVIGVGPQRVAPAPAEVLDWTAHGLTLGRLVELLPTLAGPVHVRRIPSQRLAADVRALAAVAAAPGDARVGDVLTAAAAAEAARGEEPEAFFALAGRVPCRVDVLWTGVDGPEFFDVVLVPVDHNGAGVVAAAVAAATGAAAARQPRSNNPLHAKLARRLVPELRRYLGDRLPEFMIPSAFTILDRLPVSPNGKLDRDALPPPVRVAVEVTADDTPATPVEAALADIWGRVLGLEQVPPDASFFALGGDSVLSIQVVARATEAGLRVTPGDIVRYQSIRELAAAVADRHTAAPSAARPFPALTAAALAEIAARTRPIEDAYPLSAYQGELLRNLRVDPPARPPSGLYVQNLSTTIRTPDGRPIDEGAIAAAWQAVGARHSTFRASLQWRGLDEPFQVVHAPAPIAIEHHDLSGQDAGAQMAHVDAWIEDGRARGFVLEQPGHVRIGLFRTRRDEVVMVWLYHYLFSDGWSVSYVLGDFLVCYDAILRGVAAELSAPAPYRRYIEYQRGLDPTDTEAFWRGRMAGFAGVTPLVSALGGTPMPAAEAGAHLRKDRRLSIEASAALRELARRAHVTLNNVVQAAWLLMLAKLSGRDQVSFGSMMSGRTASLDGYERMVGIFTGVLPMAVTIAPGQRLIDWMQAVQAEQAELATHHHASLSDLRRWSGRPGDAALFESCVVFINWPVSAELFGEDGPRQRVDMAFVGGQTQTEHPVRFVCFALGPALELQFFHYQRQLPDARMEPFIAAVCDLLERLGSLGDASVAEVLASIHGGGGR
jgi:amino acid adenylation domain-containing protein